MEYHHLEGEEEGVEQVLVVGEDQVLEDQVLALARRGPCTC